MIQCLRYVYGIDHQATFAPVIRDGSVEMLLTLSVQQGLNIHCMNVATAFPNSQSYTDIPVNPLPPPHTHTNTYTYTGFDLKPGYLWKLNSALYNLKQLPMLQNNHIKGTLSKIGFKQNKKEFGLYFRKNIFGLCLKAL